ncbi:MAG: hypothetical protein NG712_02855 [Omnitrophica bacterium]|nr:hypothetical protein [Candidatus Omnitrophota bacterium]
MNNEELYTSIEKLQKHSDERDDIIEKKLDKLDEKIDDMNEWLRNGLSEKIVNAIKNHLNERFVKKTKWFFSILVTAALGVAVKLIFFV